MSESVGRVRIEWAETTLIRSEENGTVTLYPRSSPLWCSVPGGFHDRCRVWLSMRRPSMASGGSEGTGIPTSDSNMLRGQGIKVTDMASQSRYHGLKHGFSVKVSRSQTWLLSQGITVTNMASQSRYHGHKHGFSVKVSRSQTWLLSQGITVSNMASQSRYHGLKHGFSFNVSRSQTWLLSQCITISNMASQSMYPGLKHGFSVKVSRSQTWLLSQCITISNMASLKEKGYTRKGVEEVYLHSGYSVHITYIQNSLWKCSIYDRNQQKKILMLKCLVFTMG